MGQGDRKVQRMIRGPGSYAEWLDVPWESGTLTALAKDSGGKVVANTSRHTNGQAAKLQLTIDAPSVFTGTGSAVVLDGQDVALLRGAIVDSAGRVMHLATNNISFAVISGPGEIQGTGNGDPHCHEPNNAPWHSAYHGLVRAVVRVTSTAARSKDEKALLSAIDMEGPMSVSQTWAQNDGPIVVEASSPGFDPVRVIVQTSTDMSKHGVYAAAAEAAGKPVDF